jgi:hypothetical protein
MQQMGMIFAISFRHLLLLQNERKKTQYHFTVVYNTAKQNILPHFLADAAWLLQ